MEKTKIMYMTDYSTRTGFGGVADNVCKRLTDDYDVYLLGWGFHYQEPLKRNGYILLPTGQHPFGADVLPSYLMQIKPEVLIVQADTRMVDWLPMLLQRIPNKPTWIYYPVIDGHVFDIKNKQTKWPSNWTAVMKQADIVVGMTKFGQKILKANGIEDAKYIPHGVDTGVFRSYSKEQKQELRKSVVGGFFQNKFVVGGVFKNINRKNPEKYLQAFALFRRGKEDKVVLLLHTPPNREVGGEHDLVQQATDIGLEVSKDVIFSTPTLKTEEMPNLYNCMDVFWNLGGMEGFDLPLLEAMACGVPVVSLDATTHPEILGDTGILSKPPTYPGSKGVPVTFGSYNGVECKIPNPYDIAKQTERLYKDEKLRQEISFKEVERVVKYYDWSVVIKQWKQLLKGCIITEDQLPEEWKRIYEQTK